MMCYIMLCYVIHPFPTDCDGQPVELGGHPVRCVHGSVQGGELRQAERLVDDQDEEETQQGQGDEQRDLRNILD